MSNHKLIVGQRFIQALIDQGLLPEHTIRVNIDAEIGKAAAKLRRTAQPNDGPTVKPPTLEHYSAAHLKETGRMHLIEDGVPVRDVSPKKAKVAPLPPSMPKAVNIRRRWGLPSGLESYDTTTRNVLELINR